MDSQQINLGIDASRCRSGGSINHIKGILAHFTPSVSSISYIHLWSYSKLLDIIPNYEWLIKHKTKFLDKNLLSQLFWQFFSLKKELKKYNCGFLFTADASSLCTFKNQVVLSQDLLSYEQGVTNYFGWGISRARLFIIRIVQNNAFRAAKGVIFLTNYTSNLIQKSCGRLANVAIIPHGFNSGFNEIDYKSRAKLTSHSTIVCTYVSNTEMYKHQWVVVRAIALLRKKNYDIILNLIGGGNGQAQQILESQILKSDPLNKFVTQYDFLIQDQIQEILTKTDIFVFASSCETFGITLLEGMASGLPIACSDRSSLPELLRDGGIYFDPENENSIAKKIEVLINDPVLSERLAKRAKTISTEFSWERCSQETFSFISECIRKNRQ